jgi:hypothetical protein
MRLSSSSISQFHFDFELKLYSSTRQSVAVRNGRWGIGGGGGLFSQPFDHVQLVELRKGIQRIICHQSL